MIDSVDHVIAVGYASGLISIFQLPSVIPRANNTVMIGELLMLQVYY